MAIVAITKENFEQEITQSTMPVVIEVYASWCGPCQQMMPIFEELSKEYGDRCKFTKLNVDEAREISIQYGVTSVPTFIFIKNNEVKEKETGNMSKEDLEEKIKNLLA